MVARLWGASPSSNRNVLLLGEVRTTRRSAEFDSAHASRQSGAAGQQRVQGYVVEEGDLQAETDNLSEFRNHPHVPAAQAKFGESFVARARQFNTRPNDCGIQVEHVAQLDFDAEDRKSTR